MSNRLAAVRPGTILLALILGLVAGGCVPTSSLPAGCDEPRATLMLVVADGSMEPNNPAACLGQHLELMVHSAQEGELHVHGYDDQGAEIELVADGAVVLEFDAVRAGQFPIELHLPDGTEVQVGILTINEP